MADYLSREEILRVFDNLTVKNPDEKYQHGMQDAIDCLIPEVINGMKASDVQRVRYGKWNIKDNHFHSNIIMNYAKCSCCGHTCSTTESTHNNYCPNCGAKMMKDDKQNE